MYTMGTQLYARQIAQIIDPGGVLFRQRVCYCSLYSSTCFFLYWIIAIDVEYTYYVLHVFSIILKNR
jgi:hypothetical protein